MALRTAEQYRADYRPPETDSRDDETIDRVLDAMQGVIADYAGRVIEQTQVTRTFDGSDADGGMGRRGTLLQLPAGDRFIQHAGGDLVSVTENGETLTVGAGYDTAAQVLIAPVNADRRASLYKSSGWLPGNGIHNVTVSYKCGWTVATVPERVVRLLYEMVWRSFNTPTWHETGDKVAWFKSLSPLSQQTLDGLRCWA